jgi:hypothetical protein
LPEQYVKNTDKKNATYLINNTHTFEMLLCLNRIIAPLHSLPCGAAVGGGGEKDSLSILLIKFFLNQIFSFPAKFDLGRPEALSLSIKVVKDYIFLSAFLLLGRIKQFTPQP